MNRRYDLDWMRVLLFALLVPFHAIIGFVSYGEIVYGLQNPETAGPLAELFVFFSHGWRLNALFIISGIGTFFVLRRRRILTYLWDRMRRLLIPLIFASLTLNAAYGYVVHLHHGATAGFMSFWAEWITHPAWGHTRHLWFLVNLFLCSILAIPIFLLLELKALTGFWRRFGLPLGFGALFGLHIATKPYGGPPLAWNWEAWGYFVMFCLGYWSMGPGNWIWDWLKQKRWSVLVAAIATFVGLTMFLIRLESDPQATTLLVDGGWIYADWPFSQPMTTTYIAIYGLNSFLWCGAVFGFGAQWLDRPSSLLRRLNGWVYPFYILHFPIMMVGLYFLAAMQGPWFAEFLILTFGTFIGCWICLLLLERLPMLWPFLGFRAINPPK